MSTFQRHKSLNYRDKSNKYYDVSKAFSASVSSVMYCFLVSPICSQDNTYLYDSFRLRGKTNEL